MILVQSKSKCDEVSSFYWKVRGRFVGGVVVNGMYMGICVSVFYVTDGGMAKQESSSQPHQLI